MVRRLRWIGAAALVATTASGFINPNFTLMDLFRQSELVLVVSFDKVGEDGKMTGSVVETIKGQNPPKDVVLDVLGALDGPPQRAILEVVRMGFKRGVLFTGKFRVGNETGESADAGAGADREEESAFLHLAHPPSAQWQWVRLRKFEDCWEVIKPDNFFMGTFSGGTEMAIPALRYFRDDPEAELPIESGAQWGEEIAAGRIEGRVTAMTAVDLEGRGSPLLFIASDAGDRLLAWNGRGFDHPTAGRKLASRSRAFAFGDFNGDRRLDLASWDGARVRLWAQTADSAFAEGADTGDALAECIGLAALDAGAGRASLLISAKDGLLIGTLDDRGSWTLVPLPPGEVANLGEPASALVADFDGDGQTDIVRLFSSGSRFYKGEAPGRFAEPVACAVGKGRGRYAACIGDFDHNDLPDIFTVAEDGNRLWHNDGGGRFSQMLSLSGEVPYIAKPEGVACAAVDFNNDGRQDLFIAYDGLSPHLFFNRGFRSFGHARDVDFSVQNRLLPAAQGQQAGTMADLNGDGVLDLALVLKDGSVWAVFGRAADRTLAVSAALPANAPSAGPVMVRARQFDRDLGIVAVSPGGAAFFGARQPGPISLTWRFPGNAAKVREVVLESGPVRVNLGEP